MLQMICGRTYKDKINDEIIYEMTSVVRLEKFPREQRLQWLRNAERIKKGRVRIPVKTMHLQVGCTKLC